MTGGSGFLGGGVVKALLERYPDWRVSVLDIRPPSDPSVVERLEHFFQADITSADSVRVVFAGYSPDLVLHTAGFVPYRNARYSKSQRDWERVKAVNVDGTKHVLDASLANGCRKFVYTSSCTVAIDDLERDYYYVDEKVPIGFATLHYGKSKAIAGSTSSTLGTRKRVLLPAPSDHAPSSAQGM